MREKNPASKRLFNYILRGMVGGAGPGEEKKLFKPGALKKTATVVEIGVDAMALLMGIPEIPLFLFTLHTVFGAVSGISQWSVMKNTSR